MSKKSLSFEVICAMCGLYLFIPIRWGIGGAHLTSILLLLCLTLCLLQNKKMYLPKEVLNVSVVLYFGIYTLLYLKDGSWGMGLNFLLEQLIPYYLCVVYINTEQKLQGALNCFTKAAFLYAILGIVEAVTKFNLFDSIIGTVYESQQQMMRFGIYRPRGICTMTINNCIVLCFALCLVAYYMNIKKKVTWFDKATYGLLLVNAILTLSRAALVMVLGSQILIGLKTDYIKNKNRIAIVTIVGVCGSLITEVLGFHLIKDVITQFILMFSSVFSKEAAASLSSSFGANPNGIGHRFMLYEWIFEDVGNHWLFGLGSQAAFGRYVMAKTLKTSIENYYLSRYFHFGMIGVLTSIVAILSVIIYSVKNRKRCASFEKKININDVVLIAFLMYLVVLLTVSTTDDVRVFSLMLGITVARNRIAKRNAQRKNEKN